MAVISRLTDVVRKKFLYDTDLDDLFAKLDDSVDLLAICNPNNPTSSALNTEEISKILTHCKKHNILALGFSVENSHKCLSHFL